MTYKSKVLLLVVFSFFNLPDFAQSGSPNDSIKLFYLKIDSALQEGVNRKMLKAIQFKTTDSLLFTEHTRAVINRLRQSGYLMASVDSFNNSDSFGIAYINTGRRFSGKLGVEFSLKDSLGQLNFSNRKTTGLSPNEYTRLIDKIIGEYADNGYPFIMVNPENIVQKEDFVRIFLRIDPGEKIVYDSLYLRGTAKLSSRFYIPYTGIKPGKPFVQKEAESVQKNLSRLPYLKITKDGIVEFNEQKASFYMYTDKNPAGSFSGLIGFSPDSTRTGQVTFTGDLNLNLVNAFKRGENLSVKWAGLADKSQKLNLSAKYPFLFKSPLGLESMFSLFKKDSSFLELNFQMGANLNLNGINELNTGFRFRNSFSISKITSSQYPSSTINTWYLGLTINQLNRYENPTSGYFIQLMGEAGKRNLESDLKGKTILTKSEYYSYHSELQCFLPLWKRFTILSALNSAWAFSGKLYENELFRIGGYGSFRGMDEQALMTSGYLFTTFELRYLFEERSNVYVFMDYGYWERNSEEFINDTPLGFGLGVQFHSKPGTLRLSYALAQQFNNPVRIRDAKIHIGWISTF